MYSYILDITLSPHQNEIKSKIQNPRVASREWGSRHLCHNKGKNHRMSNS